MQFSFEAKIYKVGINPCVDVPLRITKKMLALKGYIPVKGKIKNHPFQQTLVTVKSAEYRLYVNGPMLKSSKTKLGDIVKFSIEQDFEPKIMPMPKELKAKLDQHKLMTAFNALTPGRQKEILRYLNFLKTEKALMSNINNVLDQLKKKT